MTVSAAFARSFFAAIRDFRRARLAHALVFQGLVFLSVFYVSAAFLAWHISSCKTHFAERCKRETMGLLLSGVNDVSIAGRLGVHTKRSQRQTSPSSGSVTSPRNSKPDFVSTRVDAFEVGNVWAMMSPTPQSIA